MRQRGATRVTGRAVVAWLPVACLLALALIAPMSSEASGTGTLEVSTRNFVGGQMLTFSGKLPSTGAPQRIHLEFNMNRPGDEWTRIEGSSATTDADGRFSFRHPARSMRNIRVRVASSAGVTEPLSLRAQLREITLHVDSGDPHLAGTAKPRWARFDHYVRYPAVEDETLTITVDTAPDGLPVFPGMTITLQQRTGSGWTDVASGTGDSSGVAAFPVTVDDPATAVFRAVTDRYTRDGERLPSFPSFPTYVDVLHRPAPTDGLDVAAGTTTDSLDLAWTLPPDEAVDRVLVAWNDGPTPPTHPAVADGTSTLAGDATSHRVGDLFYGSTYSFAAFVRSPDGVISRVGTTDTATTLPRPLPVPAAYLTATPVSPYRVELGWQLPAMPDLTELAVVRLGAHGSPPATPGAGAAILPAGTTTYADDTVAPGTSYRYAVYTKRPGRYWSQPTVVAVTTPEVED